MKKKSAPERLAAALQEALDAEPKDIDAARRVLETEIKDDAEVLWLILEPMRKSVLNELLRGHFAERRAETQNTERPEPLWRAERSTERRQPPDTKRKVETALRSFQDLMEARAASSLGIKARRRREP